MTNDERPTAIGRLSFVVRLLFLLILIVGLVGCDDDWDEDDVADDPAPPATAVAQSGRDLPLEDFVAYVAEWMEADAIPGVAVAIVSGEQILLARGLGTRNLATGAPVTPDTLFHIASTNKALTSFVAATLVDDGRVQWDAPVTTIMPGFALSDPEATAELTIRHLLNMTGGIPEDEGEDLRRAEDVFPTLAQTDLIGYPGEAFAYSNLSYAAAGYLLVTAAGIQANSLVDGYAQLLQERLFNPVGMSASTIYVSEARRQPDHALSYIWANGRLTPGEAEDLDSDPLAPSGVVKASVTDMARFVAVQLNEGVTLDGRRVVSAANLRQTWQPHLEDYALGWQVEQYEGVTLISHTGGFDNFASVIGFLPDYNLGFVILTNAETGEDLTEEAAYAFVELFASD
jgi:CubicO group peptidase (beta-lactamase class C family)